LNDEYDFKVLHRAKITNLDVVGLSYNPNAPNKDLTRPGGMEIMIERRFQIGM
jgi:hypothetical protein